MAAMRRNKNSLTVTVTVSEYYDEQSSWSWRPISQFWYKHQRENGDSTNLLFSCGNIFSNSVCVCVCYNPAPVVDYFTFDSQSSLTDAIEESSGGTRCESEHKSKFSELSSGGKKPQTTVVYSGRSTWHKKTKQKWTGRYRVHEVPTDWRSVQVTKMWE